jgi:opacity protein-like surface antigen
LANGTYRYLPVLGALLIAPLLRPAHAATDLLNVYIGAAVGHASLRAKDSGLIPAHPGALGNFDRGDTAFQFMAGVRGLYLLGAEFDYFHLGSGGVSPSLSAVGTLGSAHLSQQGEAAFGLLYLPIPVPMLDVYVKAGVARLTSDLSASGSACSPGLACLPLCTAGGCPNDRFSGRFSTTETTFAAGAGVQWSFGNWAVRGEYERFDALGQHPDLLSVGVTWTIL